MEEVSTFFKNQGARISAVLHIPDQVPASTVMFCHGFTGHKIESHRLFVHAARHMCDKGFLVLRFDFRGSGESEGMFESMTVSGEISDLKQATSFMLDREEVQHDKIGVIGLSLGGAVSILTAAQDQRIRAVCVWASPADLKGLQQSVQAIFGRHVDASDSNTPEYIDMPSGYRIGKAFLFDVLKHDILTSCAKISPRPFLAVHGTSDELVPFQHAEMLYGKAGEPKERILIAGADHTFNRWDWQSEAIERTTEWFGRKLKSS